MSESIIIPENLDKKSRYECLIPQLRSLVQGESDIIANLANLAAGLKYGMDFFWVGFYLVKNEELVLGPFQGPIACTRIKKGKGVCGKAWESAKAMIVEDVEKFPGHISCNALSKSEIVLPVFDSEGNVAMVLDVDSQKAADFDEIDKTFLEEVLNFIHVTKLDLHY